MLATAIDGKCSRHNDIVACLVFRDGFVRPVSTAEGYVVWELTVRNARVEGRRMRRREWKRTEHVLARRGEVVWWRRRCRLRRAFTLATGSVISRGWCDVRYRSLVAPECAPAPPGHAHERVVDIHANDASSAPQLRCAVRWFRVSA
jgi:hypothetical protein